MKLKKLTIKNFLKLEFVFLFFIISIGAFLRLQGVFTNSFAFTYDVGRDLLALWNIVYSHKILLIGATSGLPGVFYGPWWYYLLTPFFILFKGNPQGIALVMSVIGIICIPMSYFFGKKIGNNLLGLAFAGFVSVSPVLISLSSQIWNPNIAPLFVLLTFFVLYKIFSNEKKDSKVYFFFLGILLAFNIDLEIVFGVIFFLGVLVSLIVLNYKNIKLKEIFIFLFGVLLISLPRLIFELRHEFLMTKSLFTFLTGGDSSLSIPAIFSTLISRSIILFNQFSSTLAFENRIYGMLLLFFVVFSLVFGYKKAKPVVQKLILSLIIIVISFLLGTTFFSHDIWPHYLVGLPIVYIFLFSLSLYLLSKNLKSSIVPTIIVIVVLTINLNPQKIIASFNKPDWQGDASVYRNQLEVIDYVYLNANGKDFKYIVYTPPVHDYTYQYLFMWYGQSKYNYQPLIQSKLAYFILEPDLQYPSRLTDWLKSREGDGKITNIKQLKSGIVIQTRTN